MRGMQRLMLSGCFRVMPVCPRYKPGDRQPGDRRAVTCATITVATDIKSSNDNLLCESSNDNLLCESSNENLLRESKIDKM